MERVSLKESACKALFTLKLDKKIAVAVYLYQVTGDGEWGEISFDFEAGTAEIVQLTELDTTVSKKLAKQAIRHLKLSKIIS